MRPIRSMGMPLYEVRVADEELVSLLKEEGGEVTPSLLRGRAASPQDLKLALAMLPDAEVWYHRDAGGWFAGVTIRDDCCGRDGFTAKFHFERSESDFQPQDFLCEGDCPVPLLWVLQGVARMTGPLVLLTHDKRLLVISEWVDIFAASQEVGLG